MVADQPEEESELPEEDKEDEPVIEEPTAAEIVRSLKESWMWCLLISSSWTLWKNSSSSSSLEMAANVTLARTTVPAALPSCQTTTAPYIARCLS